MELGFIVYQTKLMDLWSYNCWEEANAFRIWSVFFKSNYFIYFKL